MHRRRTIAAGLIAGLLVAVPAAGAVAAHQSPGRGLPATPTFHRIDPALADALAAAGPNDQLRLFVHADSIAAAVGATEHAGLTLLDRYDRVGVAVAMGTPARINALANDSAVTHLEADAAVRLFTETSHSATRGAEARHAFQPSFAEEINGAGVTIAVIDSGIDGTHPMFQRADGTSKVVRNLKLVCHSATEVAVDTQTCDAATAGATWLDLTAVNDTDTISGGGHGTHVASTAAGFDWETPDLRQLSGAATGADLVGLSVGATVSVYGGSNGLNWVLEHHTDPCGDGTCDPIRVVNNSWGPVIVGATYDPTSVIAKLQDELVTDGVVVVWANGNGDATNDGGDGSDVRSSIYGQSPTPGIISVANYDDQGTGTREGTLNASSSRGQDGAVATYPDVSAPGTNITAACRPYLAICGPTTTDDGTISGTSMAAPHVAGIVAQLFQVDPSLTPAEIENVLEDTAHKFTFGAAYEPDLADRNDGTTSFDKGHGLVDVVAAVASVLGVAEPEAPGDPQDVLCVDPAAPPLTDPEGDATQFALVNGAPSQPTLDILSIDVGEPDADHLQFTFQLLDLTATPPPGAPGMSVETSFSYAGHGYEVSASRTPAGVEGGFFRTSGLLAAERLESPTPAFDEDANTITVNVLNDSPTLGATPDPAFASGSALNAFTFYTRYSYDPTPLGPAADTGSGTCPYTVGLGAVPAPPGEPPPPPPPTPEPPADATLSADNTADAWVGEPATGSDPLVAPVVEVSGPVHTVRRIAVALAPGETAAFTVTVTAPATSYVLFEITTTDGVRAGYTEILPGQTDTITVQVDASTTYLVDVGYFVGVNASFTANASLNVV